ncbi:MAG: SIMPL domain-containing protein [Acidimicrobiia bacterium]
MRRSLILLVGVAVLITACGTDAGRVGSASTDKTTGISVTGRGRVAGTPDTMTITLGVSVQRDGVDEATADAAALTNAIIGAVTANGVAAEDVQTANYAVYPEYDWSGNRQRLIGYRVTNELRVKVRDLDNAGAVIDAATAAGGDAMVVGGLSFSIEDNTALLESAREAAWNDAEAKARQLAELSGASLDGVISIVETIDHSFPPVYFERAAGDDGGMTPIEPGQSDVTVTIQVVFAIG